MATMQGITGKLSGKMGSAVFRVRDGQQIVTQYNPIIKNPNTSGQQAQRAKFKLMSQLAAVMSPGFGTMSVTKRASKGKPSQRNAFTQLNFPLVEITTDDQEVTAKIAMEKIKLTSSFRFMPAIEVTSSGTAISIDFESNIPADVTTVRLVTVSYADNVPSIYDVRDVPAATIQANTYNIQANGGKYTVLAYGLIPSESAMATIDLDNIHTPADVNFISAVELNAMVAEGSMAETMTVAGNVTIA